MLRGIVFDMDGVVIDSHPVHRRAWKTFLQTVGREVTDAELDFILDGRKRDEILCYFLGDLTPSQIADHGAHKDEMLRQLAEDMHPFPGVVEFLDSLAHVGMRIALATSAGSRRAHGTLRELGLARYFEAIVTGDEVTSGKPDPAIYRLAAKRLHEIPENLLAIEDAVSGVKSAKSAGMHCLGIACADRAEALRAAGADPVIADFQSLSLEKLEAKFR
ncbi:MAG TPA: HAD family phosphatase [Candidatus Sulfotelmatobacter sp.]